MERYKFFYCSKEDSAEDIRRECAIVLKNSRPPKRNITKDEIIALKMLRDRKDIMVLKEDKGNVMMIMTTKEYNLKMNDLLIKRVEAIGEYIRIL